MKNNFELKGKCMHNFFMDEKEIREKSISHCGRLCKGKFIAVGRQKESHEKMPNEKNKIIVVD